jgi:SCP-2 sterol transfer family
MTDRILASIAPRVIFPQMVKRYVPAVANGTTGDIVYRLTADGKPHPWTVRLAGDLALARRGEAPNPLVVLSLDIRDFLLLAAGRADPADLMAARRLQLEGNGLLAARLGSMFGGAAPRDPLAGTTALTYRDRLSRC